MQTEWEKILSDNEKPSKDYKKLLRKKIQVNIAPKDTYASILDKINKIGFKENKRTDSENSRQARKMIK